jgi:hypothetical protein
MLRNFPKKQRKNSTNCPKFLRFIRPKCKVSPTFLRFRTFFLSFLAFTKTMLILPFTKILLSLNISLNNTSICPITLLPRQITKTILKNTTMVLSNHTISSHMTNLCLFPSLKSKGFFRLKWRRAKRCKFNTSNKSLNVTPSSKIRSKVTFLTFPRINTSFSYFF